MTYQEVLKETDTFTTEQKEQLMLFMLSKFDKKKRNRMIQLFHYENNVEETIVAEQFLNGYSEEDNLYNSFASWKNKLPNDLVINEDEFYS